MRRKILLSKEVNNQIYEDARNRIKYLNEKYPSVPVKLACSADMNNISYEQLTQSFKLAEEIFESFVKSYNISHEDKIKKLQNEAHNLCDKLILEISSSIESEEITDSMLNTYSDTKILNKNIVKLTKLREYIINFNTNIIPTLNTQEELLSSINRLKKIKTV